MKNFKPYYKRNLPHYQPAGYTYFVTYRLNGSLPVEIINQLKNEREKQLKAIAGLNSETIRLEEYKKYQSVYFGKFDKLLDASDYGPTWLNKEDIAQIVKDAMHFYDNKKYDLICYTIMSNHVHQVFTPIVGRISDSTLGTIDEDESTRNRVSGYIVTKILQDLKRYTARKCNKVLNRSDAFWQHESYDHVVRDYDELQRIVRYVFNNPVKAGLSENWEDWKWSYCNNNYL